VGTDLILDGSSGWSVNATTDAAGGLTPFGQKYGIPVYVGDVAAVPVTLSTSAAQG